MQNPMQFENFDELQVPYSSIFFCWNFAHVSYLPMSTKGWKGVRDVFYFV